MRKDEIPQECIMLSCFHRHGNDIDYFRGFGAKQCTPHDLSAMVVYNCFQHAVRERTTEVAGKRETLKEYPLFSASSSVSPI